MDKDKNTKITFSDGSYCYAESDGLGIETNSITKLFNKNNEEIKNFSSKNINWENEELYIEYPDNVKYKGKIDNNGKFSGKSELFGYNENGKPIIVEANFKDGKPFGYGESCKVVYYGENRKLIKEIEGNFDDSPVIGGIDCKITNYYSNGNIKKIEEGNFEYEELCGNNCKATYYNEKSGEIATRIEGNFMKGKPDENCKVTHYYSGGKKESIAELNFTMGEVNGKSKIIYYDVNEKIEKIEEGYYKNGELYGECKITYYNKDGKPEKIEEGIFEKGEFKRPLGHFEKKLMVKNEKTKEAITEKPL